MIGPRFSKMSGAGNDFLVFGEPAGGAELRRSIDRVCRRGTGVGADGVLFVTPQKRQGGGPVFLADYFNADGGRARFCANGTRCAARFAHEKLGAPRELVLVTGWGDVAATLHEDRTVTLTLPEPVTLGEDVPTFDPDGRVVARTGTSVQVGVPHLIVAVAPGTALETLEVNVLGAPLRRHPALPEGANVTFVGRVGDALAVRSFERGVEAETLACGSGVVAAAVVLASRGERAPVSLLTRSGETLTVDFRLDESGRTAREITLTGDARLVFEGVLTEECL